MKTIYCTNCGNTMEENPKIARIDNICPICGVSDKQYSNEKKPKKWSFCRNCGNKLDKRAEKCPRCGTRVGPLECKTVPIILGRTSHSHEDIERMNEHR